ncbi:hypothetical protein HELRODRAFT_77204 [Helobdella robusta]|uniref:Laminin EGF-like domain-containing protein n=1 Tax=Helobdella robusta TaxID=6412 RepID=T1G2U4_HELRO|nr:hypothetical protein HELRODRAFT_77204 [Helobdella robusta]ESO06965.1 hypothetical protein HELRODRAFT_77204 [Helobdella robusta]
MGICSGCMYNSTGKQCELCIAGYYVNPNGNITTMTCSCSPVGSMMISTPCNASTGQCVCKQNVKGQHCDTCVDGFVALDASKPDGCSSCSCDPIGSYNNSCQQRGGQCFCKPNTLLRNCSQCKVNSYGFGINGCTECGCHPNGSASMQCAEGGNCTCRPNVIGGKCSQCIDKNYGLASGLFIYLNFYFICCIFTFNF